MYTDIKMLQEIFDIGAAHIEKGHPGESTNSLPGNAFSCVKGKLRETKYKNLVNDHYYVNPAELQGYDKFIRALECIYEGWSTRIKEYHGGNFDHTDIYNKIIALKGLARAFGLRYREINTEKVNEREFAPVPEFS